MKFMSTEEYMRCFCVLACVDGEKGVVRVERCVVWMGRWQCLAIFISKFIVLVVSGKKSPST